jgi:hypothetical protein
MSLVDTVPGLWSPISGFIAEATLIPGNPLEEKAYFEERYLYSVALRVM